MPVERVVNRLLELDDTLQANNISRLSYPQARSLNALVQKLSTSDTSTKFMNRAKSASKTGKYRSKKGEGDIEAETCARLGLKIFNILEII